MNDKLRSRESIRINKINREARKKAKEKPIDFDKAKEENEPLSKWGLFI